MKTALRKAMSLLLAVMMIFGAAALGYAESAEGTVTELCPCSRDVWVDERPPVLPGEPNLNINGQYNDGKYGYDVVDNKAVIVDAEVSGDITIPSSLGGYEVTKIASGAFDYCGSGITSVTIPNGITTISGSAFLGCSNLGNISISQSVEEIGFNAFGGSGTEITVDPANKYYSSDEYGVLFNKDKTELICYPANNKRTSYTVPDGVTSIKDSAFIGSDSLARITIPDSVTSADTCVFSKLKNVKDIYYGGSKKQWDVIETSVSDCLRFDFSSTTIHYGIHNAIWVVDGKQTTQEIKVGAKITPPANPTKSGYTFKGWNPAVPATMPEKDMTFTAVFEKIPEKNIYNLGEETYSFDNFGDKHSPGGHCFGMSVTSSGYYLDDLDINSVTTKSGQSLHNLTLTAKVKDPICYYQPKQGDFSVASTVAGGSYYFTGRNNINSDWNEVVNYVKNHEYDGKGTLQIGFRKGRGGHAINFLRYEEVDGQPRIYAYDNNFPNVETYFYKDSRGDVRQAPESTFSGSIDCIALRSIPKYFEIVGSFVNTNYIYAPVDTISVSGATEYLMEGTVNGENYAMYKVPENAEKVIIVPLVDNAEFTYVEETYSMGNVDDETIGLFTLASDDEHGTQDVGLELVNVGLAIRTPSTTSITYGDSIILHADVENLPEGAKIVWSADNSNFTYTASADGTTCTISPSSSGDTTFTAAVVDANGNEITKDVQTMTAKAGFFQKIIAFFKSLFGMTKVIPEAFKF